tara:strand:+ start:178 stop:504 length:327 start_codon:yes stop_codon:yes gene_type:complete
MEKLLKMNFPKKSSHGIYGESIYGEANEELKTFDKKFEKFFNSIPSGNSLIKHYTDTEFNAAVQFTMSLDDVVGNLTNMRKRVFQQMNRNKYDIKKPRAEPVKKSRAR